jgi:hypothetical protein
MNFTWVEKKNRSCAENVISFAKVGAHGAAVYDSDGRDTMEVSRKLIVPVGAAKEFDAFKGCVLPDSGLISTQKRSVAVIALNF